MITHAPYYPAFDRVAVVVTTEPALEPLDVHEMIRYLGYSGDELAPAQETLIAALITAARVLVEQETGCKLLTQTVRQTMDRLPCGADPLQLYVGPVQSVTSVKVYSAADAETTLAGATYFVDHTRRAPRLCLTTGSGWPTDLRYQVAVVVEVVAGWTLETLPAPLVQAMRLLVAHWYDDCEGDTKATSGTISATFEALIRPYRLEWL